MSIVSGLFMTLTGYRTICGGIRGGFDGDGRRLVGGISVNVAKVFMNIAFGRRPELQFLHLVSSILCQCLLT